MCHVQTTKISFIFACEGWAGSAIKLGGGATLWFILNLKQFERVPRTALPQLHSPLPPAPLHKKSTYFGGCEMVTNYVQYKLALLPPPPFAGGALFCCVRRFKRPLPATPLPAPPRHGSHKSTEAEVAMEMEMATATAPANEAKPQRCEKSAAGGAGAKIMQADEDGRGRKPSSGHSAALEPLQTGPSS